MVRQLEPVRLRSEDGLGEGRAAEGSLLFTSWSSIREAMSRATSALYRDVTATFSADEELTHGVMDVNHRAPGAKRSTGEHGL